MWQFSALAAFVLAPCFASEYSIHDYSNNPELEKEFQWEVHHSKHHKHRRNPFLRQRSTFLLDESPLEDLTAGRHPAVAKKLQHMDVDKHALKSRHHVAAQARVNLEGEVKYAMGHLNEVVKVRSQLAHTEAQIRAEERKLKKLELDHLRLDKTHQDLTYSLHHVMGSKIEFAQARLEEKKEHSAKAKARADSWKKKEEQFHASSLAHLEERDRSKVHVEVEAAVEEKAHKEWLMAEKELEDAKKTTAFNIQGYQYSEAKSRAAMSRQKREEEETQEAQSAVKRLTYILNMEQARVDSSMALGKDRVHGKIQMLERDEAQSTARLDKLKLAYQKWQNMNLKWHDHLVSAQHSTGAIAQDYAEARTSVITKANQQVVSDAEADSDWAWDDWANQSE